MPDIIIIIDKKPFIADTLEMAISHYFPDMFTIIAFNNTTSAFNIIEELSIKKETVSLIICDSQMPNVNGFDFLNLINTLSPNSIKVLSTAFIKLNTYQEMLAHSSIDYILEKPFSSNSFINIVKSSIIQQNLIKEKQKNLDTIQQLKNSLSLLRNKFQTREQNFITINDTLNAFYFRLDLKNSLLSIYTNASEIFGYEVTSFYDFESFLAIIATNDRTNFIESIRKIKVNISFQEMLYLKIITKSQEQIPVKAILLRESKSKLLATKTIIGFIQNISAEDEK